MSLGRYKTAGQVIIDAMRECGLPPPAAGTVYASTDPFVLQFVGYLAKAGYKLAQLQLWRNLETEAVLVKNADNTWTLPTGWTDLGGDSLGAPADFLGVSDRTGWDRSNRLPLGGPLNAQYWQFRLAGTTKVVWAEYRADQNRLRFLPTPLGGPRTLALEYHSSAWVRPAAQGLGNGISLGATGWDAPEADGDFCLFDHVLLTAAAKLEFKKDRGFDAAAVQEEYDDLVAAARDQGAQARPLNLSGVRRGPRLIDLRNVPDSGYGM